MLIPEQRERCELRDGRNGQPMLVEREVEDERFEQTVSPGTGEQREAVRAGRHLALQVFLNPGDVPVHAVAFGRSRSERPGPRGELLADERLIVVLTLGIRPEVQ